MNDREMLRLMDMMRSSAEAVLTGHVALGDPGLHGNPEAMTLATQCFEEGALRLARCYSEFIDEINQRRHDSGNVQYPFESWELGPPGPPR